MTIQEKLQLIHKISGLTQEKLARKFNVSFPTLNSWINGRSEPHKQSAEKIDQIYKEYTGQNIIPPDLLEAKKQILDNKKQNHKNILAMILKRPDLNDAFSLALTYNTNSIEGSTLTENETADILFHNKALPNKTLIEQLEAKNHQTALQYLFRYLKQKKIIDEELILKLHSILMNGIRDDAGFYRRHSVRIVGANVPTANFLKVPELMSNFSKTLTRKWKDSITMIAADHAAFEKIHPFSDGNGRIGRLILAAILIKNDFPPAIIKQEEKNRYYICLKKAQTSDDTSLLEDLLCDAVIESYALIDL